MVGLQLLELLFEPFFVVTTEPRSGHGNSFTSGTSRNSTSMAFWLARSSAVCIPARVATTRLQPNSSATRAAWRIASDFPERRDGMKVLIQHLGLLYVWHPFNRFFEHRWIEISFTSSCKEHIW